ncbi:MAG: HEPN domain-containing protein [Methanoregula sp.]
MKNIEIDNAIKDCGNHLKNTNTFGTKIENYLVSYLLVLIINCFEKEFNKIAKKHINCKNCQNVENQYFQSSVDKFLKRYKTSDLGDFINFFGKCHREKFDKMKENRKIARIFQIYNNLQENRQLVAHETGVNVTFPELIKSYEECHLILDLFEYLIKYDPNCPEEQRKRIKNNQKEMHINYKIVMIRTFFLNNY